MFGGINLVDVHYFPSCFGLKWRSWIRGSLHSSMASILVNGSPSTEFKIHRGLKQGDPLAPYLFILIMESLHLSFSRVIEAGSFTGIKIDSSVTLSHLFYADDAIFIGEWSRDNLKCIMHVLHCFSLLSGLSLNLKKSQLLGVGIPDSTVSLAADMIGCSVLHTPFKYLGIPVGGNMNSIKAWDDIIYKIKKRLSNWKLNTLSIGGRLTLLKLVLGSTPLYYMSLYKAPNWPKVLASRENGGLGVSSFYALNRGLLAKWMWRFLSNENSLWVCFIKAAHGDNTHSISAAYPSAWNTIIKELQFPRLYALENNKECTVAVKMSAPFTFSFRREVRGGIESSQLSQISKLLGTQILSSIEDRWRWDLNGDGNFHVKDVRSKLDDSFLPKADTPTRWITTIPIKLNIFAWKVSLNRLPTRLNLVRRGVLVSPISCPICLAGLEDLDHLLFRCNMAAEVLRAVCKWWNLAWSPLDSYATWLSWFSSIRMLSQLKSVLEGVFYTSEWDFDEFNNKIVSKWNERKMLQGNTTGTIKGGIDVLNKN
ncbi:RNA-directed DNA polymerase, eukaryota [Tanacetum coccineum]